MFISHPWPHGSCSRASWLVRVAAGAGLVLAGISGAAAAAGPAFAASSTLFVSPTGLTSAAGDSCSTATYSTITAAVAVAGSGETVFVCPGTYPESVTITGKALSLVGDHATIAPPAASGPEGVVITGMAADGSSVSGFTITGAQMEGVLAQQVSGVTIANNTVTHNDLACQPQSGVNDCGEGLHLRAVTDSKVIGNTVSHNTGGIHITDGVPLDSIGYFAFGYSSPSGPSFGNLIEGNTVVDNVWDCGISLPSHNSDAVAIRSGVPNPTAGGVYDNTITRNVVVGNGIASPGAGVLMAAPFPGTASYDNTVTDNVINGNGNSGVTIHSHAPFQDVSGNVIEGNQIGRNNVLGDGDAGDPATTGVLVYSAAVPVTGTVIMGNHIVNDHYGIWLDNAPGTVTTPNHDSAVSVPVYTVVP